jgi:anti-sigma B factor antagonist
MELNLERRENVAVCTVKGDLDAGNFNELIELLNVEIAGGAPRIVLALSKMDYIDSSGLGALVKLLKKSRLAGGDTKLSGLRPEVRKVFELTRLDKIFDIFPEADAAVAHYMAAKP